MLSAFYTPFFSCVCVFEARPSVCPTTCVTVPPTNGKKECLCASQGSEVRCDLLGCGRKIQLDGSGGRSGGGLEAIVGEVAERDCVFVAVQLLVCGWTFGFQERRRKRNGGGWGGEVLGLQKAGQETLAALTSCSSPDGPA